MTESMRLTDNWREVCDWVNEHAEQIDPFRPAAYMPSGPALDILLVTKTGDQRAIPGDSIIHEAGDTFRVQKAKAGRKRSGGSR